MDVVGARVCVTSRQRASSILEHLLDGLVQRNHDENHPFSRQEIGELNMGKVRLMEQVTNMAPPAFAFDYSGAAGTRIGFTPTVERLSEV